MPLYNIGQGNHWLYKGGEKQREGDGRHSWRSEGDGQEATSERADPRGDYQARWSQQENEIEL